MAINFPNTPTLNDIYTEGGSSWQWDGTAWNALGDGITPPTVDQFKTVAGDTGSTTADSGTDTLTIAGGTDIETRVSGDTITISSTATGDTNQNAFSNVGTDSGTIAADNTTDTFNILGGNKITTQANDKDVTIDLAVLSIDDLSDVDTTSTVPTTGQVLKWDGAKWAPGTDIASGGAGLDADTLDGFDSSYYLNYNNLSNKPNINTFNTFTVAGQNNVVADSASDTLTLVAGTGVTLTTNAITDTITLTNSAPNVDQNLWRTFNADSGTASANTTTDVLTVAGGTNIGTAIVGDTLTVNFTGALGDVNQNAFSTIAVAGETDVTADTTTDTLTLVAGSDIGITTSGNNVTIAFTGVSGGGDPNQNAFSTVAVAGQSNVEADTTTDTLTFANGAGISITTDAGTDTVTIASTVTAGAENFNDLGDLPTGLTIDQIYEPAIVMLRVDATPTNSAYLFDSHYSGNNPTIYALSGTTIAFDLTEAAAHPFLIQDVAGTNYNTGLVHVTTTGEVSTGSNAQGKESGTLYWRIPESISGNYRYQCASHAVMVGTIAVKRFTSI